MSAHVREYIQRYIHMQTYRYVLYIQNRYTGMLSVYLVCTCNYMQSLMNRKKEISHYHDSKPFIIINLIFRGGRKMKGLYGAKESKRRDEVN